MYKKRCKAKKVTVSRINLAQCENPLVYANLDWCGRIKDKRGAWKECLELIDKNQLKMIFDNCVFDICAMEDKRSKQSDTLCSILEQIAESCYEVGKKNNKTWIINWRQAAQCSKILKNMF